MEPEPLASTFPPRQQALLRVLILAGSALAAALGVAALLGWLTGLSRLASLAPGTKPMAPDTAVLFGWSGVALLLSVLRHYSRPIRLTCLAAGWLAVVVALALLGLSLLPARLEIEHLGIPMGASEDAVAAAHMSAPTALGFAVTGLSLVAALSASPQRRWRAALARWLAGLTIAGWFVLSLAYLLGTPLFYRGPLIPPSATSTAAFMALGSALFAFAGWRAGPRADRVIETVPGPSVLVLVFALIVAGISTAGYWYARSDETRDRARVEQGLSSVAELMARELAQWRRERLADGALFHANLDFSTLVRRVFAAPEDKAARQRLSAWLGRIQAAGPYDWAFLLDARGGRWRPPPGIPGPIDSAVAARAAAGGGGVVLQDFYRDAADGRVHLAVLVPIHDPQGGGAIGVLGLRIDPERDLYPLLNRWPTPGRSAETLLFRREGDQAVLLNNLRSGSDTALRLRNPLAEEARLAVQAVQGRTGIVEGIDHRGVRVVAEVRAVPGSPWLLAVSMDASELHALLSEKRSVLLLLAGVLLAGAATAVGLVYGRQRARLFRDRYRAAEALRQSEERYRIILDSMLEGFQLIGRDWRYLYLNDAAARHGQREKEELLGRSMMESYPGIDDTSMFDALRRCMEERTPQRVENEFTYPDGSTAWFELLIQPAREGVFVLSLDISERKQAEKRNRSLNAELERRVVERTAQLEAANKELEAFAYSVSHDLRAPLRAIDGFSRIILEDYAEKLDAEGGRLLNTVRSNAQKMDQLITDILALSRATRAELKRSRIDMSTMASSIYHEILPLELQGAFQFSVSPLPEAWGDPTLMRQVWSNLIGNAIKFTRGKERRSIAISGFREGGMSVYRVQDNGAGFDPAYVHKLFGIFQRLHGSEEFEGTGVGLAIVQRIIHRHGGRLWAEGKVDEGATFYFSLRNEEDIGGQS